MKKISSVLILLTLLFTTTSMPITSLAERHHHPRPPEFSTHCTKAAKDFSKLQLKLWIDHMWWTRNFLISDLADLPDKDAVTKRLLKNQEQIGNSFKPYYGEEAGNKLTKLLNEHILLAAKIIDADKAGKKSEVKKLTLKWYDNANQISDFLVSLNNNWKEKEIRTMFDDHLRLLLDEINARIAKNWDAEIKAFDDGEDHMIMLANVLSDGIIKQFPEKFAR